MKNITRQLILMACLLLTCACNKEENPGGQQDDPGGKTGDLVKLKLSCDPITSGGSKVGIDDVGIKWESSDRILVNGTAYNVTLDGADAYVSVKKSDKYDAVYPAELWKDDILYVQPSQFYRSESLGKNSYPMYAQGGTAQTGLIFHHLAGVLKVPVRGSGNVASISVTDNDEGNVCGCYSLASNSLAPVSNSVHFPGVTLNCKTSSNGGAALKAEGNNFYIVLPARSYSKGITLNIELVNGHSLSVQHPTAITIAAGCISSLSATDFAFEDSQIYEYHFDNLVLGSDPVAGKLGFNTADPSKISGSEYLTDLTENTSDDGTVDISTVNINSDFSDLGKPYAYSRNIQGFTKVYRTRECYGYLSCGTCHTEKASFKLPPLTNLGDGVYKVKYTFKIAFQDGHKPQYGIQLFHSQDTPGKVLGLSVDGVDITGGMDDNKRWLSTAASDGAPVLDDQTGTEERIFIRPDDFNNDSKWHYVEITVGAATYKTVLEFEPFGSNPDQPWYIDDIKAEKIEYGNGLSGISFREPSTSSYAWNDNYALMPTTFINPFAHSYTDNLKTYSSLYNIKYIDLSVTSEILFEAYNCFEIKSLNDEDWVEFDEAVAKAKATLDAMGVKVWSIHLPFTNVKEGGVTTDSFAFEWCGTDDTRREAAVNRMKVIMRHLKPFEPRYWMIHTTIHTPWTFNGSYQGIYYRDCGAKSFREFVSFAKTLTYSDGSAGEFTIENIANKAFPTDCLAGNINNLIWFCDQCPGLGICLDTGHAVVKGINGQNGDLTSEIKAMCDKGYLKHLHIHGNYVGNEYDVHLMPGYKPGLFTSTSFSTTDTIDWGKTYKALIDNGYRGAFSYEYATPAYDGDCRDCISSYPNIVHNYYDVILTSYKKAN